MLHLFFRLIAAAHESLNTRQKTTLGSGGTRTRASEETGVLRMFAQNFSNIDLLLQILPLKDDELVMSEIGGSPT